MRFVKQDEVKPSDPNPAVAIESSANNIYVKVNHYYVFGLAIEDGKVIGETFSCIPGEDFVLNKRGTIKIRKEK